MYDKAHVSHVGNTVLTSSIAIEIISDRIQRIISSKVVDTVSLKTCLYRSSVRVPLLLTKMESMAKNAESKIERNTMIVSHELSAICATCVTAAENNKGVPQNTLK